MIGFLDNIVCPVVDRSRVTIVDGRATNLKEREHWTVPDLDKLNGIAVLSWLSAAKVKPAALEFSDFPKSTVIFSDRDRADEVRFLLRGIARITCQNAESDRFTIALIAPGPIPAFPSLPLWMDVRCEAYINCRVGSLRRKLFDEVTVNSPKSVFEQLHQNDLRQCHRLLLRTSGLFKLDLYARVAMTMLELSSDFGIPESRGMLLSEFFSHRLIAELVGASRARVTEHLAQLECDNLISRQHRRFIVRVEEIRALIGSPTFVRDRLEGPLRRNALARMFPQPVRAINTKLPAASREFVKYVA
jgi:CRP-like cAMP-binding protein